MKREKEMGKRRRRKRRKRRRKGRGASEVDVVEEANALRSIKEVAAPDEVDEL